MDIKALTDEELTDMYHALTVEIDNRRVAKEASSTIQHAVTRAREAGVSAPALQQAFDTALNSTDNDPNTQSPKAPSGE